MSTTSNAPGKPAGEIRVRFAPSPTGYLHVGGARTALFNWVFARGRGGTMILRIEDTDVERNRPELVEGILDGLRWLGVDWDEGPYFQSQRLDLHRAAAEKLVASGAAYFCYCPPEKYAGGDAVEETEDAKKEQGPRRITRCACREGKAGLSAENAAIRFRVPLGGITQFEDAVFGPREVSNEEIEDFVLLRSPKEGQARGGPTYQLSAVVDDIDMRITHVIRGSDHISNTPKQALLYRAARRHAAYFCPRPADSWGRTARGYQSAMARQAWDRIATKDFSPRRFATSWRCSDGRLEMKNSCGPLKSLRGFRSKA